VDDITGIGLSKKNPTTPVDGMIPVTVILKNTSPLNSRTIDVMKGTHPSIRD
jgi:hypothetical protein